MLEQFGATIDKVYAAAAGSTSWKEALLAIESLTGSTGAVIDMAALNDRVERRTIAGSFSEENCAEYARDYQAICPRIRHAIRHPEHRVQYDYLCMTESEMDRDPVYHWFGTHGLRYYLASPLCRTQNYMVFFSLQRSRTQGHADEADMKLLQLLQPHLARAADLADQLGTLRSYQCFGAAMLEALPLGIFALDSNGELLFANHAGRRLVDAGDGISVSGRRLRAALAGEQASLDALVRAAVGPLGAMGGGGWTRLSRASGGPPFAVFVSPLATTDEQLAAAGAKALILVHDTAAHRCASVDMLRNVFGLTDTEARLASALTGGHSVESAATLLHMQPATARSHLKAVFRKTGVARQQDLVRVLASISTISAPAI